MSAYDRWLEAPGVDLDEPEEWECEECHHRFVPDEDEQHCPTCASTLILPPPSREPEWEPC